ncbi:shikimate kinase [Rudaea cellulosilytica]|uniref:shikimate kinase n=1 Tax=Rudaea cellulosilytica TaxID=540746 RepID=UPI000365E5C1|nr:shikimate kinase [Rudaea cellulosilytica]
MNPAPSLFLIGPMGAGKTTVGRRVATQLGLDFFDLDHEIEERSGATITLIFELEGEAGFRKREMELLTEFSAKPGIVLSTGGGAILAADNRRHLRERGYVVYLETTIEQQMKRLAHDRKRPLLAAPDRRERLARLAAERESLYHETADLIVPTGFNGSSSATARRLVEELNVLWQRGSAQASPGQAA